VIAITSDRDRLSNVLEVLGIAHFRFDLEGRRIFVNTPAEKLCGQKASDLIGGKFGDILVPEDQEAAREAFGRCVATGNPVVGFRVRWKVGGKMMHGLSNMVPVIDADAGIVGLDVVAMDMTELVETQLQVHQLMELYRTLVDAVGGSVLRVNAEGRRTFVSDRAQEFLGRPKEEILNGSFGDSIVDPKERRRAWKLLAETFRSGKPVYGFVNHQKIKGGDRYVSANWVPIRDARGEIVEIQTTSTDVTEAVRMRKRLEAYAEYTRKAQEEERKKISRVLHDDTIQSLVAVGGSLRRFLRTTDSTERSIHQLRDAYTLVQDQIEALRRLCTSLRPPILDRMGLVAATQWLVSSTCDPAGITYSIEVGEGWRRFGTVPETRLFRIIQEALYNTLEHAHATNVRVAMNCQGDRGEVMIEDNGIGFDPNMVEEQGFLNGRLGLVGMQERANAMGGRLFVESKRGEGAKIRVLCDIINLSRD
jgi:PAS domain S-box-containing protein